MKIQCPCGAKYQFEVDAAQAAKGISFICPACGLDSSAAVQQLVQESLAEQRVGPVSPPTITETAAVTPGPARLKISRGDEPAQAPALASAAPPEGFRSKFCPKHPAVRATEECVTCHKPICPECMSLFGYFCSPLCRGKAEASGVAAPEYAGQMFSRERQYWAKIRLVTWSISLVVAAALGVWIWYAFIGSMPHPIFSERFEDDDRAYAGAAQLVDGDQLVFLHGGTLARCDLKTGKLVWQQNLISSDHIAQVVQEEQASRARANANLSGDEYAQAAPPGSEERLAKISLQSDLTLGITGHDVYVYNGNEVLHYGWDDGKVLPGAPAAGGDTNLPANHADTLVTQDSDPNDPNTLAERARNLTTPARLALPALLSNQAYEEQLEAALRDADGAQHRPNGTTKTAPRHDDETTLVAGENCLVEFTVAMTQEHIVQREAMRAAPRKSALNGDTSVGQTTEVANEILNDMQRSHGGDTVTEDDSTYAVTVHQVNQPGITDWTGEVTGPPQLYALKSVLVIAAGQSVTVLDHDNKKLWETSLSYRITNKTMPIRAGFGAGPVVEHDGTLYIFDEAVLAAFDVMTGEARWRVPSVGVTGLFFDDRTNLYVNTSTANPDAVKYARQIDISQKPGDEILKIQGTTGTILWRDKSEGLLTYVAGKFIYTLDTYDPNPTDQEVLNDTLVDLQKPAYLKLRRLNPSNGREMWEQDQERSPVWVGFDNNEIVLLFKREVQVLHYASW